MKNRELLESILNALNKIPNQRNVGKNGESSYELAEKLSKVLNKPSTTTNERPKRIEKCGCKYNNCNCLPYPDWPY